jgi:pyridinium-3,5-biscarboxylic acid mononucleotide synthase
MGVEAKIVNDAGVAGLQRTIRAADDLAACEVVIVAAGMEGALPSVISGLLPCPIIAVPTSVGYGLSMAGLSALLTMLNSCSSGITVVNIDNGYGAACAATLIMRGINKGARS